MCLACVWSRLPTVTGSACTWSRKLRSCSRSAALTAEATQVRSTRPHRPPCRRADYGKDAAAPCGTEQVPGPAPSAEAGRCELRTRARPAQPARCPLPPPSCPPQPPATDAHCSTRIHCCAWRCQFTVYMQATFPQRHESLQLACLAAWNHVFHAALVRAALCSSASQGH